MWGNQDLNLGPAGYEGVGLHVYPMPNNKEDIYKSILDYIGRCWFNGTVENKFFNNIFYNICDFFMLKFQYIVVIFEDQFSFQQSLNRKFIAPILHHFSLLIIEIEWIGFF